MPRRVLAYFRVCLKLFQQQVETNALLKGLRPKAKLSNDQVGFLAASCFLIITVAQMMHGFYQQHRSQSRQHQIQENLKKVYGLREEQGDRL